MLQYTIIRDLYKELDCSLWLITNHRYIISSSLMFQNSTPDRSLSRNINENQWNLNKKYRMTELQAGVNWFSMLFFNASLDSPLKCINEKHQNELKLQLDKSSVPILVDCHFLINAFIEISLSEYSMCQCQRISRLSIFYLFLVSSLTNGFSIMRFIIQMFIEILSYDKCFSISDALVKRTTNDEIRNRIQTVGSLSFNENPHTLATQRRVFVLNIYLCSSTTTKYRLFIYLVSIVFLFLTVKHQRI